MSDYKSYFLPEPDGIQVIRNYNIPYPEWGLAKTPQEAADIASKLGFPVVIKVVSANILHKSDVGGVKLDLRNSRAVYSGCEQLLKNVCSSISDADVSGVLVCKQADPGIEVIVGAKNDPVFGITMMFGIGGVFTEVYEDVTFRIAPIERIDAEEMIREIKGYPLLKGTRGQGGADLDLLIELLLNTSRMVTENINICELDLNPVRVSDEGILALDVRIFKTSPEIHST